ncbi:MAG: ABC transporter permease [Solobacterium sp.]|jgi:hypothetical protein|nr:ABC transporter permease [Solobacterium sp.]
MSEQIRHKGRIAQTGIYLGKLFRMFIYQNDWKMIPMAALIAGMVTFAVGANMFKTQEGTVGGCFSLVCVCLWNGFFNSIQVICRERPIIKREHRAGMHITSYIGAHMIYQAILCMIQTGIIILICRIANIRFPETGAVTGNFTVDFAVSLFLITYAADMISMTISCFVKNTTAAMTVMPFMLMFELIFSGELIYLTGAAKKLTVLTIVKWGVMSLCALGGYNSLPMVSLWNQVWKFRKVEIHGYQPVKMITDKILQEKKLDEFLLQCGAYNTNITYETTTSNILTCWGFMLGTIALFAVISILLLKRVDKDTR